MVLLVFNVFNVSKRDKVFQCRTSCSYRCCLSPTFEVLQNIVTYIREGGCQPILFFFLMILKCLLVVKFAVMFLLVLFH